jgi:hypothetical protein
MNSQILIDAIVRQTTVLIARLSTAEGARSPLGHIANEVFVGIVRELENQGLGKKVIADMFGLALRSYRQKVQRSGESATTRGVTLWTAVHAYLAERESASRADLLDRFKYDEEASVRGILNDLVESGMVLRSGRGDDTRYRVATDEELRDLGAVAQVPPPEADAALVWLQIYRAGPIDKAHLAQLVPLSAAAIDAAVESLVSDARIRLETRADGVYCTTDECLIPVGEAVGWEAAVIDHHRAVLNALAAKIASGTRVSAKGDEVGGTTLTFELWPGHPREAEVRKLLASTRSNVIPLWDEVAQYNRHHSGAGGYQVHYYCGQYVLTEEEPE